MMERILTAVAVSLACAAAFAQTTAAGTLQRDVNQQARIDNGLQDGSLNAREAARLEQEESRVARLQAKDLKDGKLSDAERAQLNAAQDRVSRDILAARHNAVTADPNSASSEALRADVTRNLRQEKRIEAGLVDGSLTGREVSRLERGQAGVDHREAVAGADGHLGNAEQRRIQRAENRQSRHIHHERTDGQRSG